MEDRENMENIEDRESRDVIGRKKGPVLASLILAVVLIVFTRGKGLNFGKDPGDQGAEKASSQVLEKEEEDPAALGDVLADPEAYGETLPETVEVLVDGDNVSVNGWTCRDGEELRSFLDTFAAYDRGYEIICEGAEPDALQRVREAFDSADILYAEASKK